MHIYCTVCTLYLTVPLDTLVAYTRIEFKEWNGTGSVARLELEVAQVAAALDAGREVPVREEHWLDERRVRLVDAECTRKARAADAA